MRVSRRNLLPLLALSLPICLLAETETFDQTNSKRLPSHWIATETGIGKAEWSVMKDVTAPTPPNVLKQSGEAEFPICYKQDTHLENGSVEVKFKTLSGKEDQAAGVIWRCKDKNNYYVVRANSLEDNIVFFHTLSGHREVIKMVDVRVTPKEWHTLHVDFHEPNCFVSFDGKRVLETTDKAITGAGMVGVWTKSDSVTLFDDFRFEGEK